VGNGCGYGHLSAHRVWGRTLKLLPTRVRAQVHVFFTNVGMGISTIVPCPLGTHCHPQWVGARRFVNYRVGGRIHPHSQAFVCGYLSQSSYWLSWDCMDSKESSMLAVIVAGSWWYVNRFRVDDRFICQTLDCA